MTLKFNFSVKDLGIKEDAKAGVSKVCKSYPTAKKVLEDIRNDVTNAFVQYLLTTVIGIGEMWYSKKCPKPPTS